MAMKRLIFEIFLRIFRMQISIYKVIVEAFPPARMIIEKVFSGWSRNLIEKMMAKSTAGSAETIIEAQGSKMLVDLNNEIWRDSFLAYASNLYEQTMTGIFKKAVKPGDVVVDVGANVGYFTLLAAKLTGESGRVFAFEPEPDTFMRLSRNAALNGYNNIELSDNAVSNANGRAKLYISHSPGGHAINQCEGIKAVGRGHYNDEGFIEIETVTLDDYLKGKAERVDVLKMDVEGAEYLALMGMRDILKNNEGIKIFLEYCPLFLEKMGDSGRGLIDMLMRELGFGVYIIKREHTMRKYSEDIVKVSDYEHLSSFLDEGNYFLNLYLERNQAGAGMFNVKAPHGKPPGSFN